MSINSEIDNIMANKKNARIPEFSEYRYEKQPYIDKAVTGFAGNQPDGGTKFGSGGGWNWEPEIGPSISVSLGAGYARVSLGICVGSVQSTNTKFFANAPNTVDFFRLKVTRTNRIVPTKVYGKRIGSSSWEYLYNIYPATLQNLTFNAVKVI